MYVLITTYDCRYCYLAKEFLTTRGKNFKELNIAKLPDVREFFVSGGFKTVPQIFKDGVHIGGYNDLTQKYKDFE